MSQNHYDAIIIGTGIGGLTTASLLSQLFQKRVLLLEQHFKIGGFTHTFKRKDFEWDVGIHYIGNMEEGSSLCKLVNFLTEGKLHWNKMKEPFEEFINPEIRLKVYGNKERYIEELIQYFPKEKDNIVEYFNDIEKTSKWFSMHVSFKSLPKPLNLLPSPLQFAKNALITTKEYLDYRFQDPVLKSIIVSRWGDYGLPPSKSTFIIHSLIEEHYFNGGWYPDGGSSKIAETILPTIYKNGGEVLLSHRVDEILIKNNTAIGVKVSHIQGEKVREEKEFFADVIVSNAGIYNTLTKMISENNLSINIQNKISQIKKDLEELLMDSMSNVTLYLGLKDNPENHQIEGRNYWIYRYLDHDEAFTKKRELLEGKPTGVYVSFPSLKNNNAKAHTAEIISFVDYEPFIKWKGFPWKNRGESYENLKNMITESLIDFTSKYIHNLPSLIEYKELSTPITNEFFSHHPRGVIYGIPCTKKRFEKDWIGPHTPIQNLFITGADASTPGFAGAMMGGFASTAAIMSFKSVLSLFKLLNPVTI
ncbi:MAG: phytoene dehydrogenase [Leptospiraceae bacterium]|nr:MAG: phytoene dehydrogenase [Leptospiraceae bacterium]